MSTNSVNPPQNNPVKKQIKPALLIIDTQNKYLKVIQPRDKELAFFFINLLIDLFRKHGSPVIRIYHLDKDKAEDTESEDFQYSSSLHIKPEDTKLVKNYSDSFNKTDLDELLKKTGTNTLFLCGLSAVGCVLATMIGAMNHDYQPFIVKDAIMSHNTEYTRNVEAMFDAIGFNAVKLILENC